MLNPPGTGAEGTAIGTSSLEAISCYFPLLLESTHKAGWSHLGFGIVPDCRLKACGGTNTSTARRMVVLDPRDGFSTPSAVTDCLRFLLLVERQEKDV